jgi:hypothetical protein
MIRFMPKPVLLLAALLACAARGAAHEQTINRGSVMARLSVKSAHGQSSLAAHPLEVSLSGELNITLVVEVPAGIEVGLVPVITKSTVWRQRNDVAGWETTKPEDGRVRRRQTYRLSPWQAGEAPLVIAPVRFRETLGQDSWEEITWKPIPVRVSTMIEEADVRDARDITGIEELPSAERSGAWWIGLLVALAAAIVGFVGWLGWRARPRSPSVRPPAERALSELARLEASIPATPADVERYLTLLSEVARRYLEARFGFRAPQQTTAEFLKAAGESAQLQPHQQVLLRELLERCDLAKFARTHPTAEDCRAELARARSFVEETRGFT